MERGWQRRRVIDLLVLHLSLLLLLLSAVVVRINDARDGNGLL